MNVLNIVIIIAMIIYMLVLVAVIKRHRNRKRAISHIVEDKFYIAFFEKKILEKINIPKRHEKTAVYIIRFAIIFAVIYCVASLGYWLTTLIACALLIITFANIQNKKTVEATGITYIEDVNIFLDSFIPAIASGKSNEQAMLQFVDAQGDENLFNWWMNKDNLSNQIVVENKWKRIIEIYNMVKFNEERGISNSLPIVEEMQKDISTKQKYYNDYKAKMGEIKPIVLSYYFGVPFIIMTSWSNTKEFWFSTGGLICCFVLAVLFFIFEMLINKIKKSTIESMF